MSERDDSIPGPHRPDWIEFLGWMARNPIYNATDIVLIVGQPADWATEYKMFQETK